MRSYNIPLAILLVVMLTTSGCVAPKKDLTDLKEDKEEQINLPSKLNLIASTPDRDIDRSQEFDILVDANGSNTLILWVSTGCSGCHDWTEMIAESMRNGSISNDTRIITIHRYPAFESQEEVIDVYATNNSTTNSLWPVLMPVDKQPAIDVEKGVETDYDYTKAFDNPATPSFTILDGEGKTIWKNKTYWANQTVLEDALEKLNS